MFAEANRPAAGRARGAELARTAEALLAEARLDTIDPAHAVQLATASALLALYWEMREQRPGVAAGDNFAPADSPGPNNPGPNNPGPNNPAPNNPAPNNPAPNGPGPNSTGPNSPGPTGAVRCRPYRRRLASEPGA